MSVFRLFNTFFLRFYNSHHRGGLKYTFESSLLWVPSGLCSLIFHFSYCTVTHESPFTDSTTVICESLFSFTSLHVRCYQVCPFNMFLLQTLDVPSSGANIGAPCRLFLSSTAPLLDDNRRAPLQVPSAHEVQSVRPESPPEPPRPKGHGQ